jgi:hypothetical protein
MLIQRVADCRYLGQGYELRVDCGAGAIDDAWVAKLRADFDDIHEREYSRRFEESDVEIPNVRVRGIGLMPTLDVPRSEPARSRRGRAPPRGRGVVPRRRRARAGADALLRPRALEAATARGPGDRQPVRLDDGDPAGLTARIDRFGNIVDRDRPGRARPGRAERSVARERRDVRGRAAAGPPTRKRVEVDPITLRVLGGAFHAIAKEMAGVLFR